MKLFSVAISLYLMALPLSSLSASDLPDNSPVPGGVAIVPVADVSQSQILPKVMFRGHRVMVVLSQNTWLALIGLGLDLKAGEHTATVTYDGDRQESLVFQVKAKQYKAQYLKLRKKYVTPGPEEEIRIAREFHLIRAAFATWTSQAPLGLRFGLPVKGRLSSKFGLRRFLNKQKKNPHSGLDIAAPDGTPIHVPLAGKVIELGNYYYNGNAIFLDHGQGLVSMYNHLSKILVEKGQKVTKGEILGRVGSTGRVTGAHLHWTISLNNQRVDPDLFLDKNSPAYALK